MSWKDKEANPMVSLILGVIVIIFLVWVFVDKNAGQKIINYIMKSGETEQVEQKE